MNRKRIILTLLGILLILGLYLMLGRNAVTPSTKNEVNPQSPSSPALPAQASQGPPPNPNYRPAMPTIPPGVVVPPEVARNPTALTFFLDAMTPISFYGKVVDEKDGTPIAAATAKLWTADKIFQDPTNYTKTTDAKGLFSLTMVHGLAVGIAVSKEGYYQIPKSYGNYGYAPGQPSSGPRPTRENPAIFMLRKKGVGVHLLVKSFNGHLPANGTPVDVDLEAGKVVPSNTGDFRMELWSNYNSQEPNNPYDWKYQISVPGGGLITRTDDLDFMAPSDDYQTTDEATYSYTADPSNYLRDLDKKYFVKLADGKYASITISMGRSFNILAYINPTPGDRNLEPASK